MAEARARRPWRPRRCGNGGAATAPWRRGGLAAGRLQQRRGAACGAPWRRGGAAAGSGALREHVDGTTGHTGDAWGDTALERAIAASLPAHDDVGVILQALIQLLVTHAWGVRQWGVSRVSVWCLAAVSKGWVCSPSPAPGSEGLAASTGEEPGPQFQLLKGQEPRSRAQLWAGRYSRVSPQSWGPYGAQGPTDPYQSCSRSHRSCGSPCRAGLGGSARPGPP